jgi:hypothetical protein
VRIDTESARRVPEDTDAPQSVIHAPEGFKGFVSSLSSHDEDPRSAGPQSNGKTLESRRRTAPGTGTGTVVRSNSSTSEKSSDTVKSPINEGYRASAPLPLTALAQRDAVSINTQVPAARHGAGSTPRASTQEEAEEEWRRRKRGSKSWEGKILPPLAAVGAPGADMFPQMILSPKALRP